MIHKDNSAEFHSIPLYSILPDDIIDFNIYRQDRESYILISEKGDPFPRNLSNLLASYYKHSDPHLFINRRDEYKYYHYLENALGKITKSPQVTINEKSKLIYETSARIIDDLFEKPESKEAIEKSKILVANTIDLILSNDDSIRSMMEIGSHDYYTYTHSVDVAVFSIGFANYLNFSDSEIARIGYAAIMHDIGKSKIPSEIINKQGKLTEDEFTIMKLHPVHSYEILQYHGETNEDVLKAARHHHEKACGRGYPDGLFAHETHEFAKIIAIADIFSALTTKRSYKDAYSSFNALNLMKTQMIDGLNAQLFKEYIKFMGKASLG